MYNSECDKCNLNYGPICTTLPGGMPRNGYTNTNCNRRRAARTEVGDFVYCEKDSNKFGPGTPYGTPGWSARNNY